MTLSASMITLAVAGPMQCGVLATTVHATTVQTSLSLSLSLSGAFCVRWRSVPRAGRGQWYGSPWTLADGSDAERSHCMRATSNQVRSRDVKCMRFILVLWWLLLHHCIRKSCVLCMADIACCLKHPLTHPLTHRRAPPLALTRSFAQFLGPIHSRSFSTVPHHHHPHHHMTTNSSSSSLQPPPPPTPTCTSAPPLPLPRTLDGKGANKESSSVLFYAHGAAFLAAAASAAGLTTGSVVVKCNTDVGDSALRAAEASIGCFCVHRLVIDRVSLFCWPRSYPPPPPSLLRSCSCARCSGLCICIPAWSSRVF
jgi:hypothetical protein